MFAPDVHYPKPHASKPARGLFALATLIALLMTWPVQAQKKSTDEAKIFYEKATAAYGLGNYAEAALHYEKAFELKPDSALLFNAAQAHRRAGNKARARTLYMSYLQVFPKAANREAAARWVDELGTALASEAQPKTPETTSSGPAKDEGGVGNPPNGDVPSPGLPVPAQSSMVLVSAPPPARPALVERPWFWVAIGAVAVAAGVAIVMGTSGSKDPKPSFGTVPLP